MRVITIGPGESTEANANRLKHLDKDIKKISYAPTYHFLKNDGVIFDYLTWFDPASTLAPLEDLLDNLDKGIPIPQIIIPKGLEVIDIKVNSGFRFFLNTYPGKDVFYNESVKKLKDSGNLKIVDNYVQTFDIPYDHEVFTYPEIRFKGNTTFIGTVPCINRASESDWARENLFSRLFLPFCFDLGATEVYNIGFDNRGKGYGRQTPQFHNDENNIGPALDKFRTWLDWEKYHGMKIYSVAEDKYTPNNRVLPYKPLDEITGGH